MAVWQFVSTDKHTIEHLIKVRTFYTGVLVSMNKELGRAQRYEKYGLPNWRMEMIRRQVGVSDALESFWNVQKAIDHLKDNP